MTPDPIHVLESAYDLRTDRADWVRSVASAMHPLMQQGFGTIAYAVDFSGEVPFSDIATVGGEPGSAELPPLSAKVMEPGGLRALAHAMPRVTWVSESYRSASADDRALIASFFGGVRRSFGFDDIFGFNVLVTRDQGYHFAFPGLRGEHSRPELCCAIGAHLALAARARAEGQRFEVLLDACGRVADLRVGLPDAAIAGGLDAASRISRIRRARGDQEAVASWGDTLRGGWMVLDHVDTDGKRFVLVRRVPLADREREVVRRVERGLSNKEIAFELALAEPTVSGVLRSALRKLGLSSRLELVRRAAALATGEGG